MSFTTQTITINAPITLGLTGPAGPAGSNFTPDATGTQEGRDGYDNESSGFSYLDTENGDLYFRQTETVGVWSPAIPFIGGATNLTVTTVTATALTIESSTGTDVVLPLATTSLAGIMSAADKTKLNGIRRDSDQGILLPGIDGYASLIGNDAGVEFKWDPDGVGAERLGLGVYFHTTHAFSLVANSLTAARTLDIPDRAGTIALSGTAEGFVPLLNSSGVVPAARLGTGASITTKFLRGDGTWQEVTGGGGGTGDVVGPASATVNAIALFNNIDGKLLKNSTLTYTNGFGVGTVICADADLNLKGNGGTAGTLFSSATAAGVRSPTDATLVSASDGEVLFFVTGVAKASITASGLQLGSANARITTILNTAAGDSSDQDKGVTAGWVKSFGGVRLISSDTTPGTPNAMDEWFDSATGARYVRYGSQWVETSGGALFVNQLAYAAKTANYTLTSSDAVVNCTANNFTVTLPTAVGISGRIYVIKNSGTGIITVATTSSQTIDGGASGSILLPQYSALQVISDGANWIII